MMVHVANLVFIKLVNYKHKLTAMKNIPNFCRPFDFDSVSTVLAFNSFLIALLEFLFLNIYITY